MSKIIWRKDVANAPKDKRGVMIARAIVPNTVEREADVFIAIWHSEEVWVSVEPVGTSRRGPRVPLDPIYWAELFEVPEEIKLRELTSGNFAGRVRRTISSGPALPQAQAIAQFARRFGLRFNSVCPPAPARRKSPLPKCAPPEGAAF